MVARRKITRQKQKSQIFFASFLAPKKEEETGRQPAKQNRKLRDPKVQEPSGRMPEVSTTCFRGFAGS